MALLRSLVRRPLADAALVGHAMIVHLVVASLLRPIGLRRLAAWLSCVPTRGAARKGMVDTTRVVWAVRTATHLLPAGRSCLTEALAAQHLLRWHGTAARLRLGVSKVADAVTAHAWLESAGHVIIGGEVANEYQPLIAREEMR